MTWIDRIRGIRFRILSIRVEDYHPLLFSYNRQRQQRVGDDQHVQVAAQIRGDDPQGFIHRLRWDHLARGDDLRALTTDDDHLTLLQNFRHYERPLPAGRIAVGSRVVQSRRVPAGVFEDRRRR